MTRVHPTTLPSTEIHRRSDRRKRMFDRYGRDTVEATTEEIFRHSEQFDSETIWVPTTPDSTTYMTPKIPLTTSRFLGFSGTVKCQQHSKGGDNRMATATEGYVEAQTGRLRAEAQADLAQAMLRIHKDRMFFVTWIVGTGVAVSGVVIAFMAVLR